MAGEAERRSWIGAIEAEAPVPPIEDVSFYENIDDPDHAAGPRRWPALLLGGALLVLAIAWIAALAWAIAAAAPAGALTPLRLAAWVGLGSGPLALLAVLALLALRTGAVEANEFARRARLLRRESDRLALLLQTVNRRIDAAGRVLAEQGAALADAGQAAGERLGRAGQALRVEAETFAHTAAKLDDATAAARTDLGVLLADLPDAESRAEGLSVRLREFGTSAADHAGLLADRLAAIEMQARAADQSSAAGARRLAVELERIEAGAAAAERRVAEVAGHLGGAADAALGGAATALEDIRAGLADQSAALAAMVAQARTGFGVAADDAARALARQLDALDQRLDSVTAGLRGQETAARGLLGRLDQAVRAVQQRLEGLGDAGAGHIADLAEMLVRLSGHAEQVGGTLGESARTAEGLLARAEALRDTVTASGGQIADTIPTALARLRLHAEQGLQAIGAATTRAEKLAGDADAVNARLAEGARLIAVQEQAVARLDEIGTARLETLAARLADIAEGARAGETELLAVADRASPALADALERVRDAAREATAEVRAALDEAIPAAAGALADSAAREVTQAIAGVGRTELAQVGLASMQAVEAARGASDRLTRQLLTIAEATQALEAQIADQRQALETADESSFARQAGLLIEALNSIAIDVAKLFSNDPPDTAWTAYLKGDRGVFTRRAVRLLDQIEVKAIADRHRDDPDFRLQLDRYVHDFEALLRRLMSVREGEAMSVALLSSDMGKLYVALAQAIERLRR